MTDVKDLVVQASQKLAREEEKIPAWVANDLPWRKDRTPFRVFLAEFLLIRTRADVVAVLFEEIVGKYPNLKALANTGEDELASALDSLGLRKRVPLLLRATRYILKEFEGEIPADPKMLKQIPGIGRYTSKAIAAFAFDKSLVPADVNILRFVSRLTGLEMEHQTKGSEEIRALLPLLSKERDGPSPEALLDFTRAICKSRQPLCEDCPVRTDCQYYIHRIDH